jgi:hypothetical protein
MARVIMTDLSSKTAASQGPVCKAKLNVFIAYARQDVVAIDRLLAALPARTSRPWSIEGASRWAKSGGRAPSSSRVAQGRLRRGELLGALAGRGQHAYAGKGHRHGNDRGCNVEYGVG